MKPQPNASQETARSVKSKLHTKLNQLGFFFNQALIFDICMHNIARDFRIDFLKLIIQFSLPWEQTPESLSSRIETPFPWVDGERG